MSTCRSQIRIFARFENARTCVVCSCTARTYKKLPHRLKSLKQGFASILREERSYSVRQAAFELTFTLICADLRESKVKLESSNGDGSARQSTVKQDTQEYLVVKPELKDESDSGKTPLKSLEEGLSEAPVSHGMTAPKPLVEDSARLNSILKKVTCKPRWQ